MNQSCVEILPWIAIVFVCLAAYTLWRHRDL